MLTETSFCKCENRVSEVLWLVQDHTAWWQRSQHSDNSLWKMVFPWWMKPQKFFHSRLRKLALMTGNAWTGFLRPALQVGLPSEGGTERSQNKRKLTQNTPFPGCCAWTCMYFIFFGFQSKHTRWLFMFPFFRLGSWGSAPLSDLSIVRVSRKGQIQSQVVQFGKLEASETSVSLHHHCCPGPATIRFYQRSFLASFPTIHTMARTII